MRQALAEKTKVSSEMAKLKEEHRTSEAAYKKAVDVAMNEASEQARVLIDKMKAEIKESKKKKNSLLQEKKVIGLIQ